MTSQSDEVHVAHRFRGPPTSGNGGYVAGLVAERIDGPAQVDLLAPIPLEVPLHRRRDDGDVMLFDANRNYAHGRPLEQPLDFEIPGPPTEDEVEAAAMSFPGPSGHPIPGCFVCGTERGPGDGLCIYPGESPHRDVAVAEWTPDESLADEHGHVAERYLWAVLDCPSYFGLCEPRPLALLARLSASIERPVLPGERLSITAWELNREGRKHHSATVIHDQIGEVVAAARALWIEVESIPEV
ncbi:MAG TPA: hotdog fold domain-containing protein [Sphingomicrobium sp.]|nr:hotdog fold domain-containing protein [Sphingomicrobium sp.]